MGKVTYWKFSKSACKGREIPRQAFDFMAAHNHDPEPEQLDVRSVRIEVSSVQPLYAAAKHYPIHQH